MMFSKITKAVGKAYKASKKFVANEKTSALSQTQAYKLINSLCKMSVDVLPISKLNQIADMSFLPDQFEIICSVVLEKLHTKKSSDSSAYRYIRNLLLLSSYLTKHGAGGFIDEFRDNIQAFELYTHFEWQSPSGSEKEAHRRADIRERAAYIITLLTDKEKLLREKQLAMLVKQKIRMHSEDKKENFQGQNEPGGQSKLEIANGFLEGTIYKYINRIDQKLDDLAQLLADQIEKLVLGEIPESFEAEYLDDEDFEPTQQRDLEVQNKEKEAVEQKEKTFCKRRVNGKEIDLLDV